MPADNYQSFYKVTLSFFMEVARHVQSNQNMKLVIFLQYIKKKLLQLLFHSILMQNIEKFHGGPVMFVVTCLLFCTTMDKLEFLSKSADSSKKKNFFSIALKGKILEQEQKNKKNIYIYI